MTRSNLFRALPWILLLFTTTTMAQGKPEYEPAEEVQEQVQEQQAEKEPKEEPKPVEPAKKEPAKTTPAKKPEPKKPEPKKPEPKKPPGYGKSVPIGTPVDTCEEGDPLCVSKELIYGKPKPKTAPTGQKPKPAPAVATKPKPEEKKAEKPATTKEAPQVKQYGKADVREFDTDKNGNYGYEFQPDGIKSDREDDQINAKKFTNTGCLHDIVPLSSEAVTMNLDELSESEGAKLIDSKALREKFKQALQCMDDCRTPEDTEFLLNCFNWSQLDKPNPKAKNKPGLKVGNVVLPGDPTVDELLRNALTQDFMCNKAKVAQGLTDKSYQRKIRNPKTKVCESKPLRLVDAIRKKDFNVPADKPEAPQFCNVPPKDPKPKPPCPPGKNCDPKEGPPKPPKPPGPPGKQKIEIMVDEDGQLNHKTDIVILVDNSQSMHKGIGEGFVKKALPAILAELRSLDLTDARLILMTQNLGVAPKVLDPNAADLDAKVNAALAEYFKYEGDGVERPLEALRQRLPGVVRPDASIVIFVLADEEDSSPLTAKQYAKSLNSLTSQKVTLTSTVADASKTKPFNGLYALKNMASLTGGRTLDFDQNALVKAAGELVKNGQAHELILRHSPDEVVGVTKNGQRLDPSEYKVDRKRGTIALMKKVEPTDQFKVIYKIAGKEIEDSFTPVAPPKPQQAAGGAKTPAQGSGGASGGGAPGSGSQFMTKSDQAANADPTKIVITGDDSVEVLNPDGTVARTQKPGVKAPTGKGKDFVPPQEVQKKATLQMTIPPRLDKAMNDAIVLMPVEINVPLPKGAQIKDVKVLLDGKEQKTEIEEREGDMINIVFFTTPSKVNRKVQVRYTSKEVHLPDLQAAMKESNKFEVHVPYEVSPEMDHKDVVEECQRVVTKMKDSYPFDKWSTETLKACFWMVAPASESAEYTKLAKEWTAHRFDKDHPSLWPEEAQALHRYFGKHGSGIANPTLNPNDLSELFKESDRVKDVSVTREILKRASLETASNALPGANKVAMQKYAALLAKSSDAEDVENAKLMNALAAPSDCKILNAKALDRSQPGWKAPEPTGSPLHKALMISLEKHELIEIGICSTTKVPEKRHGNGPKL